MATKREQKALDQALEAITLTSARLYEVAKQADAELAKLDGVTYENDMGDVKARPQIKILTDCNNQLRQNVRMLRDLSSEEVDDGNKQATVLSLVLGDCARRQAEAEAQSG